MNTRMFYQTHGRKYVAVPEDYSLERSFTAVTPEGILRYYVFDGEQYRKTYYVLVLLEPYHIAQMKDADRWMLHYEPAADVTR